MKTIEVLMSARAIISDPVNWLQQRLYSSDLTSACAVGALVIANNSVGYAWNSDLIAPALHLLAENLPDNNRKDEFEIRSDYDWHKIAIYNNTHTHEEVLALFDTAIAKALVIQSQLANTNPAVPEPELAFRSAQLVGV